MSLSTADISIPLRAVDGNSQSPTSPRSVPVPGASVHPSDPSPTVTSNNLLNPTSQASGVGSERTTQSNAARINVNEVSEMPVDVNQPRQSAESGQPPALDLRRVYTAPVRPTLSPTQISTFDVEDPNYDPTANAGAQSDTGPFTRTYSTGAGTGATGKGGKKMGRVRTLTNIGGSTSALGRLFRRQPTLDVQDVEAARIEADHLNELPEVDENVDIESDDEPDILVTKAEEMEISKIPESYFATDVNFGLKEDEYRKRKRQFGDNVLPEEKTNHIKKFFSYFTGPIEILIIIAGLLAAGLQRWIDLGIIAALLILNATVGFLQEYQAENVVNQLKSQLALKATVVRNGVQKEIDASDLVPGDIVFLEEGDVCPADMKLLGGEDTVLQMDQSSITGESMAVSKRPQEFLYSTSAVKRGQAYAVVVAIAEHTFVGRAAMLVSQAKSTGHFRQVLNKIALFLMFINLFFAFILIIATYYVGTPFTETLLLIMVITVVAVPIALPAVTTTTLAVGASILAKKKAIVQRLTAIESLAGVDILCSDKTGTITKNKLKLHDPFVMPGANITDLMVAAALASHREGKALEPIDKAIVKSLPRYRRSLVEIDKYEVLQFNPFDPVSKRVTAIVQKNNDEPITVCKGATQAVIQLAEADGPLPQSVKDTYDRASDEMASRGFRSLGVAWKVHGHWQILGVLSLFDPPRDDSAQTIREAKELGVKIKMLTGDHLAIAIETAKRLGMGTKMFDSTRLLTEESTHHGATLADYIEQADGFAQVYPEHKYRVVEILQSRGHLVAMTGDGVNDAPALKKADAGIAVQGATEAARSAAAIVFVSPGLGVIIDAIRTSRRIFHRMHGYCEYRIALSIHLVLYITFAVLTMRFLLSPTLVVFLAIFSDIAVLTIAYDRAPYAKSPVHWNLPRLMGSSVILALLLVAGTFIIHTTTLTPNTYSTATQSIVFLEIALTQNFLIFSTRTEGPFYLSMPSWRLIGAVLLIDTLATLFVLFGWFTESISIVDAIRVWVYSIGVFLIMDVVQRFLANSPGFNRLVHGHSLKEHKREDRELEDQVGALRMITQAHKILSRSDDEGTRQKALEMERIATQEQRNRSSTVGERGLPGL